MNTENLDNYLTVSSQPQSVELKIKGSKFIGHVFYVLNKNQAEAIYANIRRKYHDATHNCYAYRISSDEFRYSDDGEPSGTGGKPIYQVLQNKKLVQTIIIVTRYFGGTKLGIGGLSRAYAEAAIETLKKTKIEIKTIYKILTIETAYETLSYLLDLITKFHGIIGKTEYSDRITYCVQIPLSRSNLFASELLAFTDRGIKIIEGH
jgi:uncharacterized YigZ family protein